MPANPDWTRWIFASVADALKTVATDNDIPVLVEHLDERTKEFERATDKVEIRITGPWVQELSKGYYRVWVDVNALLQSRYDGQAKNAYTIHKNAGLFQAAMSTPIGVWNYGSEPSDFSEDDPDSQVFLGCLLPRPGKNDSIRVNHFGQVNAVDKLKESSVDARFVMYLDYDDN